MASGTTGQKAVWQRIVGLWGEKQKKELLELPFSSQPPCSPRGPTPSARWEWASRRCRRAPRRHSNPAVHADGSSATRLDRWQHCRRWNEFDLFKKRWRKSRVLQRTGSTANIRTETLTEVVVSREGNMCKTSTEICIKHAHTYALKICGKKCCFSSTRSFWAISNHYWPQSAISDDFRTFEPT